MIQNKNPSEFSEDLNKKRNNKRLDKLNIKIQVNHEEVKDDHISVSSHSVSS